MDTSDVRTPDAVDEIYEDWVGNVELTTRRHAAPHCAAQQRAATPPDGGSGEVSRPRARQYDSE